MDYTPNVLAQVPQVNRKTQKLRTPKLQKNNKTLYSITVYMAAVLEYLVAEVLELSGNAARDNKRQRIIPRHIMMAVRNDSELDSLFKNVTISEGGVIPLIHPQLLPKTSKKTNGKSSEKNSEEFV